MVTTETYYKDFIGIIKIKKQSRDKYVDFDIDEALIDTFLDYLESAVMESQFVDSLIFDEHPTEYSGSIHLNGKKVGKWVSADVSSTLTLIFSVKNLGNISVDIDEKNARQFPGKFLKYLSKILINS